MRAFEIVCLAAACSFVGCHRASRCETGASKAPMTGLEGDLKRFLNRTAPEPSKNAAFDQEVDENHWPLVTRRGVEKKLEASGLVASLKSTLTLQGVLKSRGGDAPQTLKGVSVYLYQGAVDYKDIKGRFALLSVSEAGELSRALDSAKAFLASVPAEGADDLSFSQSVSREVQIFVRAASGKTSGKPGEASLTLYCRDASIRLKAEQVPVLKQHLDDSRSWAEAQKDDFALLGVKPGPK